MELTPPPPHTMQEKTLEDKIQTIVLMALNGAGVEEKEAEMQARVILPMIQEAISEAREEGRKEGQKDIDENLRTFVRTSIDNNWQFTEEQVIKAEVAWNKLMEKKLKEAITQYKEELLGKIKLMEITSQTERSLDEAVKTTWNNCLSEIKKLL